MTTEKRLIDATPIIDECKECSTIEWNKSVYTTWAEAEEDFMQRLLDAPTVDAVEVVHSRFFRIADFGDGEGCFGYCEKCGTVHHSQSTVALKADHRWCRWCGAKMDGDENG